MKAVQYEDIIKLEQPKLVSISPNGKNIAWIITKSDIKKNCTLDEIYHWFEKLPTPTKLLQSEKIHQIKWIDGCFYSLIEEKNKYKIIFIKNGKIKELVISKSPISAFEISRNQPILYFSQITSTSSRELKKRKEEGYVYQWNSDNITTLTEKRYGHYEYEKIWKFNCITKKKNLITHLKYNGWLNTETLINKLIVSPNEDYLAVQYKKFGNIEVGETPFLEDIHLIELKNKKSYPLAPDLTFSKINPCWISDSEIVFQNRNYINNEFILWRYHTQNHVKQKIKISDELNANINSLSWDNEQNYLIATSDNNIYTISLNPIKIDNLKIGVDFSASFSLDSKVNFLGGFRENINQIPQIIRYDLNKQKIETISTLNSYVENLLLGEVEAITIKTDTGLTANGYLLYPINRKNGSCCPLIIATYGFHGKTHKINIQEWHSTFPAQIFAKEGYFVLLLNDIKSFSQAYVDDAKKARDEEGWNVLNVFEYAVTFLDKKGLIDPEKIGLYGWSHGAFIVEFLISHSTKFKAASIGEGGDYNPGCFWLLGMQQWTKIFNNTFDGPPWGETLKNYLDFSPFFQIDKIKTPLLLEFSQRASCVGLEMYVPLRYLNIPAEFVIYDSEEHNFRKPKARLASMTRKVEWFNYWLLDKKELIREDQYDRWDKMRKRFTI